MRELDAPTTSSDGKGLCQEIRRRLSQHRSVYMIA